MSDVLDTYSTDGNLTLSTLSFVPDLADNGRHISCRADNPSLEGSALEDGTKLVVHCKSGPLVLCLARITSLEHRKL